MMRSIGRPTALGLWLVLAIGWPSPAWAEGSPIVSLTVTGAQQIESATIVSRSGLTVGATADADRVREAIKAVYRMGYFDEVSIDQEPVADGIAVTIVVTERPRLTQVRYEGYDAIGEDKLKEQVTLNAETFIDLRAVSAAAAKLRQYYISEGYAEATVIPVTKAAGAGAVSVTFVITEGRRAKIREVVFEGNRRLKAKRLQKALLTKPYRWLTSWITSKGIYKPDDLEQDVERLRDLYLNEGYVQIQIGTPRVVPLRKPNRVRVVFPIVEGEQYRVERIRLSGHALFSAAELETGLALREGEIFRRNLLREDITTLTDRYGERGYAFVDIRPQFVPHPETRKIDLTYEIREGLPVTVRTITITGHEKTYDKVIRRELRVAERELVNTKALKRSFQRINNLNFFENVEILPNPIGDDQMDLTVRVKEKPTGTFSVGGGYSSVDGPVFQTDVTQGNLFGRGQLLRARLEKSTKRTTNYTLTFREPYLLDYPVSGTVDLFSQERKYSSYKDSRTGGSLSLGKAFGEYVTAGLTYTRETTKVFDLATRGVVDGSGNPVIDPLTGLQLVAPIAPPPVVEAAALGKVTTSSLGLSLTRDTRDVAFDPREGQRHSLSLEYAGGPLRGDNRFYRVVSDHSAFFPMKWTTVLSVHLRLGYLGGGRIPFSERFVVGGINSIRGFEFGHAGPIDELTRDVLGGNKVVIMNAEYVFPLVTEAKMKGVIFFDAGRGYDRGERITWGRTDRTCAAGNTISVRSLRYSAGFGIRMLLPIGPIRLEWGYNLDPQCDEKRGLFPEFTIGTVF